MHTHFSKAIAVGVFAFLFWSSAFASAVFQTPSGDVRATAGTGAGAPVSLGQRIQPGTTVTTGTNGRALLRFDDGQAVYLNPESEFKVTEFQFNRENAQSDNIVFDLLKGAMRSVSGLIGSRSTRAFALRVPQATIGIRGTDFMVALINPAYLSVLNGAISAANAAGSVTFAAGTLGTVATSATLAASITAAQLPAAAVSAFSEMSAVAISAGAGAGAASSASAGGLSAGAIGAIAAGVAAAVAVSSQDTTQSQSSTTGTTGTTGTSGTSGTR
jgi:hypothetical protein